MKKVLLYYLLTLIHLGSFGQTHSYDIFWGKDKIGAISAVKAIEKGATSYNVSSEVNFRLMGEHHRISDLSAQYKKGILHKAFARSTFDGKEEEQTSATYQPATKNYLFEKNPDLSMTWDSLITFSVAQLWFKEPINKKTIFSEVYLDNCSLKELSPHHYELTMPDKKTTQYIYEDGQLVKVLVKRTAFTLEFRLAPSSK